MHPKIFFIGSPVHQPGFHVSFMYSDPKANYLTLLPFGCTIGTSLK
jgi:hypothetical protein